MTRRGRNILAVAILAVAVIAAAGVWAYHNVFGFSNQFNAAFYAAAGAAGLGPFTDDSYEAVLSKHVDANGMVDYAGLKAHPAQLDTYALQLAQLPRKTYEGWTRDRKIAFWINAYNALTLKVIVDRYPIRPGALLSLAYPANSIRQIAGVWDRIQFEVMSRRMTLNDIEHKALRAEFKDPWIHVALVCAAMSCPPLRDRPYTGKDLRAELLHQARRFLNGPHGLRVDRNRLVVGISSIFKWYGGDFVADFRAKGSPAAEKASLSFIAQVVGGRDADYLGRGVYRLEYLPYDWSLNERKAPAKAAATEGTQ